MRAFYIYMSKLALVPLLAITIFLFSHDLFAATFKTTVAVEIEIEIEKVRRSVTERQPVTIPDLPEGAELLEVSYLMDIWGDVDGKDESVRVTASGNGIAMAKRENRSHCKRAWKNDGEFSRSEIVDVKRELRRTGNVFTIRAEKSRKNDGCKTKVVMVMEMKFDVPNQIPSPPSPPKDPDPTPKDAPQSGHYATIYEYACSKNDTYFMLDYLYNPLQIELYDGTINYQRISSAIIVETLNREHDIVAMIPIPSPGSTLFESAAGPIKVAMGLGSIGVKALAMGWDLYESEKDLHGFIGEVNQYLYAKTASKDGNFHDKIRYHHTLPHFMLFNQAYIVKMRRVRNGNLSPFIQITHEFGDEWETDSLGEKLLWKSETDIVRSKPINICAGETGKVH